MASTCLQGPGDIPQTWTEWPLPVHCSLLSYGPFGWVLSQCRYCRPSQKGHWISTGNLLNKCHFNFSHIPCPKCCLFMLKAICCIIQVKKSMEDGTFGAFCHFLAEVFAGITKFSLLLQKNETILPQVREMKWDFIFNYVCY